jgi:hypothetical protein
MCGIPIWQGKEKEILCMFLVQKIFLIGKRVSITTHHYAAPEQNLLCVGACA